MLNLHFFPSPIILQIHWCCVIGTWCSHNLCLTKKYTKNSWIKIPLFSLSMILFSALWLTSVPLYEDLLTLAETRPLLLKCFGSIRMATDLKLDLISQ